jgi:hypothetical protein
MASIARTLLLSRGHQKSRWRGRADTIQKDLADPLSAFQVQVAKERALALLSLADPASTRYAAGLRGQEASTGKALSRLAAADHASWVTANTSGSAVAADMRTLLAQAGRLGAIRSVIARGTVSLRPRWEITTRSLMPATP